MVILITILIIIIYNIKKCLILYFALGLIYSIWAGPGWVKPPEAASTKP